MNSQAFYYKYTCILKWMNECNLKENKNKTAGFCISYNYYMSFHIAKRVLG